MTAGAPATRPPHGDLAERTITDGSASKELRLIGWRVGWVVGLTNVVCQVGLARAALDVPDAELDVGAATAEWARRRWYARAAAGPADAWGPSGERYLRIVFANEPEHRLTDLGDRFRQALGSAVSWSALGR